MECLDHRSTQEVLDDHLHCRMNQNIEADISRNYSENVAVLTANGDRHGHGGVPISTRTSRPRSEGIRDRRQADLRPLRLHRMACPRPGRSVEDGVDSFVVQDGKIVFQSIHYTLMETMPD
jgi:hypothetical protein